MLTLQPPDGKKNGGAYEELKNAPGESSPGGSKQYMMPPGMDKDFDK
jgi:hypothetical protein